MSDVPPPAAPAPAPAGAPRPPHVTPAVRYAPALLAHERKRLIAGVVIGIVTALVLLVGTPLVCSAIDAEMNPGELAGLGGFFLGAMIGAGALLMTTVIVLALPARRRNALLRGAGNGLMLITALAGLTLGLWAVM